MVVRLADSIHGKIPMPPLEWDWSTHYWRYGNACQGEERPWWWGNTYIRRICGAYHMRRVIWNVFLSLWCIYNSSVYFELQECTIICLRLSVWFESGFQTSATTRQQMVVGRLYHTPFFSSIICTSKSMCGWWLIWRRQAANSSPLYHGPSCSVLTQLLSRSRTRCRTADSMERYDHPSVLLCEILRVLYILTCFILLRYEICTAVICTAVGVLFSHTGSFPCCRCTPWTARKDQKTSVIKGYRGRPLPVGPGCMTKYLLLGVSVLNVCECFMFYLFFTYIHTQRIRTYHTGIRSLMWMDPKTNAEQTP